MHVLLITTRMLQEWEGLARKPVNRKNWEAVAALSWSAIAVLSIFVAFCVVTLAFLHFRSHRGFCYWTNSDLYLFFSNRYT